jgi:tripartite-type tricarboxylate transporter receptor subunit TctC
MMRKPLRMACAWALGCGVAGTAPAQRADYPNRPIRAVVPAVSGGPLDVIGRLVGQKLLAAWGQNVLIDNRPGAGGILGTELVVKSPPDGYTMLHFSSAHALLPAFNKLPYDPIRDFSAITPAARTASYVLGVHPSVPANSVAELVALARKKPGQLNYGNSGHGGVLYVAMEVFNAAAKIRMTPVQYKGIGQLVTDLAGGHIEVAFLTSSNALGLAQQGKIRALGVSSTQRWKQMPNVPTIDEAGIKGYEFYSWFAFWFPAATPADLVNRMQAEIAKAVAAPDVLARFDELGFEPYPMKPEEFTRLVQKEMDTTIKLAAKLGIKPQ